MADEPSPGVTRYHQLVALWMRARVDAGGKLSQAEEADHMAKVDRVWTTLTEDEQLCIENDLAATDPPRT